MKKLDSDDYLILITSLNIIFDNNELYRLEISLDTYNELLSKLNANLDILVYNEQFKEC